MSLKMDPDMKGTLSGDGNTLTLYIVLLKDGVFADLLVWMCYDADALQFLTWYCIGNENWDMLFLQQPPPPPWWRWSHTCPIYLCVYTTESETCYTVLVLISAIITLKSQAPVAFLCYVLTPPLRLIGQIGASLHTTYAAETAQRLWKRYGAPRRSQSGALSLVQVHAATQSEPLSLP